MHIVFPLLLFAILALLVFLCDWGFKHILWQFMSRTTAVQIRWTSGLIIWAIIGLAVLHGHEYQRYKLKISRVIVRSSRLPKAFNNFRIAQISDLHLNTLDETRGKSFLREAFDSIFAQNPDAIVFTGDLVSYNSEEAIPFREELTYLASKGIPVFSTLGNHDYADYDYNHDKRWRTKDRQRLIDFQTQCGWTMLNNEQVVLHRGNDSLRVVGVENIGEPPFSTYGKLKRAMGGYDTANTNFTILLSHNPTHWRSEVLPRTQIDLTLSGHTHAMQFAIFGWSPSSLKYKEWGGLYTEGAQSLYVNTGLGTVGLPFRIGVGPEISCITLIR